MKAPKKYLKRLAGSGLAATLLIGSITLTGCNQNESDAQAAQQARALQYEMLQNEIAVRDSMIDEMIIAFDKVDANLETIREKERQVRELAEGEEASGDRKERIARDIKVINTLMADNRSEIARLRSRLQKSGVQISSLEERLSRMESESLEKDQQISELRDNLTARDNTIAGLADTLNQRDLYLALQDAVIDHQDSLIEVQENEMNTAYFATGTFKELKDRGLVEKQGAVLGVLGGKKAYTAEAPEQEFIRIDQRQHTSIPVFAKKAEIVTAHPENSFKVVKGEKGDVYTIEILNPDAFWESSKYLVVAID